MDKAWDVVAAGYGFKCSGCMDNCCTSFFFHHTFIEKAYLLSGLKTLTSGTQKEILSRAETYCNRTFSTGSEAASLRIMCPVNEEGRCLLYPYRPMICRLHGIPHEMKKPGGLPVKGPGCRAGGFDEKPYIAFDRTPFYRQMALLEMDFRKMRHLSGKIKQTVAQMLLSRQSDIQE